MAELGAYNFKVSYKPGVLNGDADALSRRPVDDVEFDDTAVKALLNQGPCEVECMSLKVDTKQSAGLPVASLNIDWEKEQQQDAVIAEVRSWFQQGQRPGKSDLPGLPQLLPPLGCVRKNG